MRKWIASIAAASVVMAALAGCGGAKQEPTPATPGTPAAPKGGASLVIWSHLTEPEVAEVNKLAQEWATSTGNKVEVLADQTGFQEFSAAASAGKGPDIMYGLPHDNLGTFQKAGFLEPVPAGVINNADYEKVSLDAVSYDGKLYAVPVSMEAVGLLYNKKMVPNAPKTWDEFVKAAQDKGFVYDIKNFYFSYGFIGGMGGYVFKANNGALDPKDVGLGNEGAQKALALMDDFVNKYKLMPLDINGDMAKATFVGGKAGMYISGPWDIKAATDAGIDLGVAPMPTLPNGKPFTPFVGVQAAFVSSGSKNKAAAFDLVKYLNEKTPMPLFKTGNRFPVQTKVAQSADVKANVALTGFGASAANGVPMPNIPAMSTVWEPAGKMIDLFLSKQVDAKKAGADAVKAINDAVAAMK
ncbi:MAG TPA: maltose ABC transporter substrate-binding protein [Symbiobacteriaceae bacterium]|jgi:arabinogalactan oligomer/maltooligosaccharide transport system substrate-binding protein|nr:maltose ABC transporter substrate-binding protein [Symbiobacteriaceae bacterium]